MKIDQYQGFVFDGEGYITDHQSCRKVIKFNFECFNDDKADTCMQLCLDFLNKEGTRFKKSVYDEVQYIYDYFIEMGQNDDAALIWDLAEKMGLLLNKGDSNDD